MGFKLVRVDSENPCEIHLLIGNYLLGRGEFLDCSDKKVSRKHGNLTVTNDEVIIVKALHQNPCFYQKKGQDKMEILKKDSEVSLCNGDKFGLLPDTYWYEVLHCTTPDVPYTQPSEDVIDAENSFEKTPCVDTEKVEQNETCANEREDTNYKNNLKNTNSKGDMDKKNDGSSSDDPVCGLRRNIEGNDSENTVCSEESIQLKIESPENERISSPSLLDTANGPSTQESQPDDIGKALIPDQPNEPNSPLKRGHSTDDDADGDNKKIKVEPDNGQPDDRPGPSNDGAASSDNSKPNAAAPQSPNNANSKQNPLRERCMYGANCYRRNVQHRVQFCHPTDPDWGVGERGVCPWGRHCQRRDPRHFRDHDHPDGRDMPPLQPGRQKKRNTNDDTISPDAILTGKRARKTIKRPSWSGSESENEYDTADPFLTDESDEWQPPTDYTESQDYSQLSQDL